MLYGKRFGLLQQDVEEESLNFIKAVKTVWMSLYLGLYRFFYCCGGIGLNGSPEKKEIQASVLHVCWQPCTPDATLECAELVLSI